MTTNAAARAITRPPTQDATPRYDGVATAYDATRGASPSLLRAILHELGPANGRTLLEVGCGTGNYAAAFCDAGFRVLGLDRSLGMLGPAAQKLRGHLAHADAEALPLADNSVDCVVTVNVFHHFLRPLQTFREFLRVARDCTLHHLTTGEQYRAHWAHHYFPLLRYERPGEHPSRDELVALLETAGFRDVAVNRFDYTDTVDVSFMPLRSLPPERLLSRRVRSGISTFRRLRPEEDEAGAAALAADIAGGRFAAVRQSYNTHGLAAGDGVILLGHVAQAAPQRRAPAPRGRRPLRRLAALRATVNTLLGWLRTLPARALRRPV